MIWYSAARSAIIARLVGLIPVAENYPAEDDMRYAQLAVLGAVSMALNNAPPQAQPKEMASIATPTHSAIGDEAAIRQWLDRWGKAFSAHNISTMRELYAPDVVAYDLVPPLEYVGRDAYLKDYEELLNQYDGPITVEYKDLRIATGGNLAFAGALERLSGTLKGGEKSDIWVRFTSEFRRVNGTWVDFYDHVSVPADMATGKAVLDLKPPKQ